MIGIVRLERYRLIGTVVSAAVVMHLMRLSVAKRV